MKGTSRSASDAGGSAGIGERELLECTTVIACGFAMRNRLETAALPELISVIYHALRNLTQLGSAAEPLHVPAVPPEQSVTPDFIVCLEDGRRVKLLKRYLRRRYSMTPEQYRARWNLPQDYPMVAPAYGALRSKLAKRHRMPTEKSR